MTDPASTIARLQERIEQLENSGGFCAYCGETIPPVPGFLLAPVMRGHLDKCERHPITQMKKELAALADRNRALTEALEKYGRHLEDCRVKGWFPPQNAVHRICTCGLGAILHPTQPKEQNDGPT